MANAALTEMVRYTERQLKKAQDRQTREMAYLTAVVAEMNALLAEGKQVHSRPGQIAVSSQSLKSISAEVETLQDQLGQLKDIQLDQDN